MPLEIEAAIARERRLDAVARHCAEQQHERERGVRWSGCGPDRAPPPRSEAQLRSAATVRLAALQAWRCSAGGRLARAISQAQRAAERAYAAADAAHGALTRGDGAAVNRCGEAADVIEAQGHDLIAAARATREAMRVIDQSAASGS
jgi:hypothetical protein